MNPLMRKHGREIKFKNLEEYVESVIKFRVEPFGVLRHWEKWKKASSQSPSVFFIHYEHIHKCKLIDEFLGLLNNTCKNFGIRDRLSSVSCAETEEYLRIMRDMDKREGCNCTT